MGAPGVIGKAYGGFCSGKCGSCTGYLIDETVDGATVCTGPRATSAVVVNGSSDLGGSCLVGVELTVDGLAFILAYTEIGHVLEKQSLTCFVAHFYQSLPSATIE